MAAVKNFQEVSKADLDSRFGGSSVYFSEDTYEVSTPKFGTCDYEAKNGETYPYAVAVFPEMPETPVSLKTFCDKEIADADGKFIVVKPVGARGWKWKETKPSEIATALEKATKDGKTITLKVTRKLVSRGVGREPMRITCIGWED